jgi:hypothetical protein
VSVTLCLELTDFLLVLSNLRHNGYATSDSGNLDTVMLFLLGFGMRIFEPLRVFYKAHDIPIPRPKGSGFDEVEIIVLQVAEVLDSRAYMHYQRNSRIERMANSRVATIAIWHNSNSFERLPLLQ